MSFIDDIEIAAESVPVVLALTKAIALIYSSKEDPIAQLAALDLAAEAVKKRQDEIKFPNESEEA